MTYESSLTPLSLSKAALIQLLLTIFGLCFVQASQATPCGDRLQRRGSISFSAAAAVEEGVSPGTIIRLGNQKSAQVAKVLSLEGSSAIYLTTKGQVLRIVPSIMGFVLNGYVDGYAELQAAGIPLPLILDSQRDKWILTDHLDIEFSLMDIMKKGSSISPAREKILLGEFRAFAAKFAKFNLVEDLHLGQMVYVKSRGWVLLDWMSNHKLGNTLSPFLMVFTLSDDPDSQWDPARMVRWRRATDKVIADARGQSPQSYYSMTIDRYLAEVFSK